MGADTATFGADAKQWFDTLARMQEQLDQLAQKHENFGRGFDRGSNEFLESSHRVRRNVRELIEDFSAQGGSIDAVRDSFLKLGEIFRIGLPVGIGVAVGVGLAKGLTEAGEAAIKLDDDLAKIHRNAIISGNVRGPDEIKSNLVSIGQEIQAIQKESLEHKVPFFSADAIGRTVLLAKDLIGTLAGLGTPGEQEKDRQEKILQLRRDAANEIDNTATSIDREREINEMILSQGEKAAELKKAELDNVRQIEQISSLEAVTGARNEAARDAAMQSYSTEIRLIEYKHSITQSQLDLEEKIAGLHAETQAGAKSGNQERLQALKEQEATFSKLEFNAPAGSEEQKKFHNQAVRSGQAAEDEEFRQFLEQQSNPAGFFYKQQQEKFQRDVFNRRKADSEDATRRNQLPGLDDTHKDVPLAPLTPKHDWSAFDKIFHPLRDQADAARSDTLKSKSEDVKASGGGTVETNVAAIYGWLTKNLAAA